MEKNELMELNRETAMRLWGKTFGKQNKAKDYSGRVMAKGAYNDRNSEYGWNVDHILPKSRGGTTADYNLVCCHILTNDEKADRFPCFNANGNAFEIIKVQNHYEIRARQKREEADAPSDETDYYDSASGLRRFKKLKGWQTKHRFVGTVFIFLQGAENGAVMDFIEEMFDSENISFSKDFKQPYSGGLFLVRDDPLSGRLIPCANSDILITVSNYDMPLQSDTKELLDKCVLLNTYLSSYFLECEYISGYDIYYREDRSERRVDFFDHRIEVPRVSFRNSLYINNRIINNVSIENRELLSDYDSDYKEYDCVYTNLQKHLEKEANG